MRTFTYTGMPARVRFGQGLLGSLADESERLGIRRALVVSTPDQRAMADTVAGHLGERAAAIFAGAAMHTPVAVTDEAMREVAAAGIDGVVAVGGGSTTGLAKAIALRTDLPQLILPTTYAGSEMTPVLGQTEDGRKTTLRDPRVLPETVLYDIDLSLGLPVGISTVSGLNAMAHAVEALYAVDGNPVISLMAREGLAAMGRALPGIVREPGNVDARADAMYAAWLCGICLGSVSMALHHKLCHTLGGMFNLPHAETHAVLLPHAMRYNTAAAPEAARQVAEALGGSDAAEALQALARSLGAPTSLRQLGVSPEGLQAAAQAAAANPYPNPASLTEAGIAALLLAAYDGELAPV